MRKTGARKNRVFEMKTKIMVIACSSALAACGTDDPDSTRFANSGEVASIPTTEQRYNLVSGDEPEYSNSEVTSISYDPATDTLTVEGDPFDLTGDFERTPQKDVRGFAAFQNEGGARRYLALVRTDVENDVSAAVVGTPVRLDNEFGGTMLARGAIPDLPKKTEVRHVGSYAGLRNVGVNDGADMSNSSLHRVEGRVQLDLDFFDDRQPGVEGVIFDRRSMDQTVEVDEETGETRNVTYEDVVLRFTNIDDNGNFIDDENLRGGEAAVGGTVVGRYDGMIAGDGAAASAGVVVITEGDELERGGFIARTE